MGVWEEDFNKEKVMLDDESLDILTLAFEEVTQLYKQNLNRKPTSVEIEALLTFSLKHSFEQMNEQDLVGCKLKTKKRKKKSGVAGDVITVPLNEDQYVYGMIVKDVRYTEVGVYMEFYNIITEKPLKFTHFKRTPKEVCCTIYTGLLFLEEGQWQKIGHIHFNQDAYQLPKFSDELLGNYYICDGAAEINPEMGYVTYQVSEEEAAKVKNPMGLFGSLATENYLKAEIYHIG